MSSQALSYYHYVLTQVSEHEELFVKELRKAIDHLEEQEVPELERWCLQTFGQRYGKEIKVCFDAYRYGARQYAFMPFGIYKKLPEVGRLAKHGSKTENT